MAKLQLESFDYLLRHGAKIICRLDVFNLLNVVHTHTLVVTITGTSCALFQF
jgi:hypothetical protein